jgi:hypothetical protein
MTGLPHSRSKVSRASRDLAQGGSALLHRLICLVCSGWLWRTLFTITVVLVTVPQILSAGINWGIEQGPAPSSEWWVTRKVS